jgi:hypothetical protein
MYYVYGNTPQLRTLAITRFYVMNYKKFQHVVRLKKTSGLKNNTLKTEVAGEHEVRRPV